jgi:hypothetical protein
MKRLFAITFAFVFAAAALPALANNSNPYASDNSPHATLQFRGGFQVQRLIPLYLFTVNGRRALKKNANLVYLKPGTYTLKFRAKGIRNKGHVPGANIAIPGTPKWRKTDDTIKVTLKAGKTYYIAGKPHGNGAWSAVVWKKTSTD